MQNYSYYLSLKIWHPTMSPDLITEQLGMEPTWSFMVGKQRRTPKGNKLEGKNRETFWVADPFGRREYSSTDDLAEDSILEVVSVLEGRASFLEEIRRTEGRIELYFSSVSNRNYAIELPPSMLLTMARLGISFVHDVYQ